MQEERRAERKSVRERGREVEGERKSKTGSKEGRRGGKGDEKRIKGRRSKKYCAKVRIYFVFLMSLDLQKTAVRLRTPYGKDLLIDVTTVAYTSYSHACHF